MVDQYLPVFYNMQGPKKMLNRLADFQEPPCCILVPKNMVLCLYCHLIPEHSPGEVPRRIYLDYQFVLPGKYIRIFKYGVFINFWIENIVHQSFFFFLIF